ncbi:hypothetical protein [Mycoplasmopsis gallopavonis]|uniref:Phosphomevalonate kinase n=1 Tax=Mycoplasmopsis gallopavonis TaxID=76629 RepID=A0A449AZ81_9BACT|nr:hypothetical protein [Mycoplasmopsis gallopavonis]RIV16390.1 hypothetical protein D1113_02550 [Mycoplasmopsis gallopavonis]VEU72766.1 phosphomevalonate kinase [Mycoplasmopsis gallopavonis]
MSKNKHVIILINGKRRSGKGLLSNKLKEKCAEDFDNNVHVLSFAQPIKQITEPILKEINWDGVDKEIVRPLWIAMGEVGRNIDNNVWCAKVFDKIVDIAEKSSKANQNSLFLIDDLRFPNELDYFKGNKKRLEQTVKEGDEIRIVSIRIEKFMDAQKFVPGVDDNSTETSFDKLVNICFDHIVPMDVLINRHWLPNFSNVEIMADVIISNFLK